jgi:carbonyl reductase 1
LLIYLTARSAERGAEAVKALTKDLALKKSKALAEDGGETMITFHALDISDHGSIHAFRDFLKRAHPEGIDVVVNNAGIAMQGFSTCP